MSYLDRVTIRTPVFWFNGPTARIGLEPDFRIVCGQDGIVLLNRFAHISINDVGRGIVDQVDVQVVLTTSQHNIQIPPNDITYPPVPSTIVSSFLGTNL